MRQYDGKENKENRALDKTFERFEGVQLHKTEKDEVYFKLMNSIEKGNKSKSYKRILSPIMTTIVAALFLFVGGYLVYNNLLVENMGSDNSTIYLELEEKIAEELGVDVVLPRHEVFPIAGVSIHYGTAIGEDMEPTIGDPMRAQVYYTTGLTEPMDEQMIEDWEGQETFMYEWIFIEYYLDETAVELNIYPNGLPKFDEYEQVEIADHTVEYLLLERDHVNLYIFGVEVDKVGYEFSYRVAGDRTEEDAFDFVRSFFQQIEER